MSFYTPPIPLVLDTDTPPPLETPLTTTPRKAAAAAAAATIPFPLKTPYLHRQPPRSTATATATATETARARATATATARATATAATASCQRYYTKKYRVRNCPPHIASECKGLIKLGNDGKKYVSKPDRNHVYKWTKLVHDCSERRNDADCALEMRNGVIANTTQKKKKKKNRHLRRKRIIYKIRDRGGYPFKVYDDGTKVAVYENTNDNKMISPLLFEMPYRRIFVGDNKLKIDTTCVAKGAAKGNTILLEKRDGHFVFVGPRIIEFSLKHGDNIRAFYSPLCNDSAADSATTKPYPYAVGQNYTYLFDAAGDDGVTCVPNETLDVRKNVYSPPQPVPRSKTLVQRRW